MLTGRMHANFLIQARGSGRIVCIHAQTNRLHTASIVLTKRMEQQRLAKPALAPWTADSQCADPADACAVAVLRKTGHIRPIPGNCPQRRVELRVSQTDSPPFFESPVVAPGMIAECFVLCLPHRRIM